MSQATDRKELEEMSEVCAYCGCSVPLDEPVPNVDDNDQWAELADWHRDGCEWIITRSHRNLINPSVSA